MTGDVVHIAGPDVQIGPYLRQRCGWCGAILIDVDLTMIVVQIEHAGEPYATWPIGGLIAMTGSAEAGFTAFSVVDHTDGDPLPDNCCGQLDPEITR